MKPTPLNESHLAHIAATYGYDPKTGSIYRKKTKVILDNQPTYRITFPDGTKTNMPVKRLAYIMAFGKVPLGYVRVKKGSNGLAPADLIEERFITDEEAKATT